MIDEPHSTIQVETNSLRSLVIPSQHMLQYVRTAWVFIVHAAELLEHMSQFVLDSLFGNRPNFGKDWVFLGVVFHQRQGDCIWHAFVVQSVHYYFHVVLFHPISTFPVCLKNPSIYFPPIKVIMAFSFLQTRRMFG